MHLQVLDGKPYNRKCDVYSFGICLWEIYCCDMPYPDLSFADVSSAVVHQVCHVFQITPAIPFPFLVSYDPRRTHTANIFTTRFVDRICGQTYPVAVQVHLRTLCVNAGMETLTNAPTWTRWCSSWRPSTQAKAAV